MHKHVSFDAVKMPIIQRVRWCCMSWRWPPWLGSYYRGEPAFPPHPVTMVAVVTRPSLFSVSHPDKLLFPPPNWSLSQSLREEQDIGPALQQVYEVQSGCWYLLLVLSAVGSIDISSLSSHRPVLPTCPLQLVNNGPSAFSQATLEVRCPLRAQGHPLLYPVEVVTEGPISCSSKNLNTMKLKVRQLTHASETGLSPQKTLQSMSSHLQLRPPGADGPTAVKSRSERHVHRRELQSEILAEHRNLVRKKNVFFF